MGQALYRKYRSKKLDEIVGQKPITTALSNALKNGQISHAYLFTGPRGVGKTSVARILAHEVNGLAYDSDELPMDIIEIDAASNRRIDEIRDLREKVRIAPVSAKYKVYIIDEVHMLTREAFNALLKTLEEPPAHVIFILATTEAHKLPETIISRTQRYSFKLASIAETAQLLKDIAKKEQIDIDDESLTLIATHSGGSLRDAVSLLDQVRHSAKTINHELVRQNFGLPSAKLISNLLKALGDDDPKDILEQLQTAKDEGASASLIAEQLLQAIRLSIINRNSVVPVEEALSLIQSLLDVETSSRPDIWLEVALISAQLNKNSQSKAAPQTQMQKIDPPLTISQPAERGKKQLVNVDAPLASAAESADLSDNVWAEALTIIKKDHNTLYGVIRMAQPNYEDIAKDQFTLKFQFPFHQKRISEAHNKQIIADTLKSLTSRNYEIICELLPRNSTKKVAQLATINEEADNKTTNPLEQIRNVFGNAEVLE